MKSSFCGIEKVSLVDYDGFIACTLFTNICNFKCDYCHNAELLDYYNYLDFDYIMDYLKSRTKLIDAVVISGGEPLLKPNIINEISEIKNLGFKIKVDTNGTMPNVLKELIDKKLVDYIAMDIKSDEYTYNKVACTSVDMSKIKESIKLIMNSGIDYEFRTTLIKEYHTTEVINNIGLLIENAEKLFLQKFSLRETCPNQSLHEVNATDADKYRIILIKKIKKVSLRGYF